jgi:hypothetical protein
LNIAPLSFRPAENRLRRAVPFRSPFLPLKINRALKDIERHPENLIVLQ